MSSDTYTLGRDHLSSTRLIAQHYIWKEQLGYLLHPSIPLEKEGLKIADVGTGTGIWLIDLSRQLPPSAQLDGFDISLSQCPPKQWLPPNVSMQCMDAFSPMPAELVEKYDVVHIAIFVAVVTVSKIGLVPLLKNLVQMLKPGGYIQWNELDHGNRKIVTADPSVPLKNVKALLDYISALEEKMGSPSYSWIGNLASIFSENDLLDTNLYRVSMNEKYVKYDNDKTFISFVEFSHKVLDPLGEGDHLRGLIEKASEECQNGVAVPVNMVVAVGRKAT